MTFFPKRLVYVLTGWLICISSCRKDESVSLKDWLGLWTGNQNGQIYFIDIQEEKNQSSFEQLGQDITYGTARVNQEENSLKMGDKSWTIDQYPFVDHSINKWKCQLDGVVYVKS